MELARGTVGDRVWGCTIASFAARRLTGELAVDVNTDSQLRVVLYDGAVVAASSPLASDSAARVGLTTNVVTSTQVAQIARLIAAAPGRDEIEVIAEALRIAPELALRLRRRVIALRAARTFALDRARYVVDDQIRLPIVPGSALDLRGVLYLGARTHVATARLASDVRLLGGRVTFTPELVEDLGQFGFGDAETPIVEALRAGQTVNELTANATDAERRLVNAVAYALAAWTMPQGIDVPTVDAELPAADSSPGVAGLPPRGRPTTLPPTRTIPPPLARTITPRPPTAAAPTTAPARPTPAPTSPPMRPTPRPPTATAAPPTRPTPGPTQPPLTPMEQARLDGDAARKRGELALRAEHFGTAVQEFAKAVELDPRNGVNAALLAWARFLGASDRRSIAAETRRALEHANNDTEDPLPQIFRGRVERLLGNEREALHIFREVLQFQPENTDAISEARVLEQRLENKGSGSGVKKR
jgi:tetratricopeptide (TPR) repeat protein